MELVTVIIILAVVSVGIFSFIGLGARIYVDVSERDQVLSEARFVVERLIRELRAAVPNSVRLLTSSSALCLEFVPAKWSSFYLDIPVAPEPASASVEAVELQDNLGQAYSFVPGDRAIVYPLIPADVYNASRSRQFPISEAPSSADGIATLTFSPGVLFAEDSPASRIYIGGAPVSYCLADYRSGNLTRHEDYGYTISSAANLGVLFSASKISLMSKYVANNIKDANDLPFRVVAPTLTRNAVVQLRLRFNFNEEVVTFNHEVQIPNSP
ncbi:type II secretion system protein [Bowmanella dokdonensis]